MRRLGSTFVTLWLTFFVPSLIVWGLMLRWSGSAADRFESIWRWTADRLAFPLLLERQTDWSWQALSSDSRLDATSRFLLLTALWAIMLALPLALIGGWWMWMTSRGSRATPPSSSASYDSQATLALSKPSSTIHSPMGALYLLTIPLALLYHTLRTALSVLRPALATFVITWAAALVIFGIWFAQLEPWEWRDAFVAIRINGWEGYLDALHIPRMFNDQWYAWWGEFWNRPPVNPGDWDQPMELRYLMALHAARHALAPAIVVAAWSFVAAVFRHGKDVP